MTQTQTQPETHLPGRIDVGGQPYMRDARGALVPVDLVRPMDLLMDETVRKVMAFARDLSAQVARFRGHTFHDVAALQALIAQEYGASLGGAKGNISLTSYDGTMKVQVQVADLIEFGPELQAAKVLIDQCLTEWGAESRVEIRALVDRVFSVGKEGAINRAELFSLLRLDIADERWVSAMRAIRESIRVIGSKQYVRFYERPSPDAPWRAVSIDIASA
jgi:hypothetical protein